MGLTDFLTKRLENFFFFKPENTQFQRRDWKICCYILELFSIMEIKQAFMTDYSSGGEKGMLAEPARRSVGWALPCCCS